MTVAVTLPIKLAPEANKREHHMATWRRNKAQQSVVAFMCRGPLRGLEPPFVVTFTRYMGPKARRFDPGNYEVSWKHVQDAVCKLLGVDDGDWRRISFVYGEQVRAVANGVRIEVRQRGEVAA